MIEDLTAYEEVEWMNDITEAVEVEFVELTDRIEQVDMSRWDVADREPLVHPAHRPPQNATRLDFFKRELMAGDFIVWMGGGYYASYYRYGLVLQVNHDRRFVRIRNHNMNKVTVWNTHNIIILARQGDYNNIPEEYLRRVGVENF